MQHVNGDPTMVTTEIFGPPVYSYSYREAVVDGFLVDYEPPIQIRTELSQNGMTWKVGEEVKIYDAQRNQIDHIVMGARASSAVRRILGSVSSQVVAEAACTVTVVRTPQHKGAETTGNANAPV